MPALFAYGTLTSTEVMCALTGANVAASAISAVLENHRLCKLRNRSYPTVVEAAGSEVVGLVYQCLDGLAWRTIDAYEGVEYVLVDATVRTLTGEIIKVKIFKLRDSFLTSNLLLDEEWEFDVWQRNYLDKAISDCVEFREEVAAVRKRELLRGLAEAKFDEDTMLTIGGDEEQDVDVEAVIRI